MNVLFDLAAKEKKDIFVEENRLAKNATVHGLFKQRWKVCLLVRNCRGRG